MSEAPNAKQVRSAVTALRARTEVRPCFACGAPGGRKSELGELGISSWFLCPACITRTGAKAPGSYVDNGMDDTNWRGW